MIKELHHFTVQEIREAMKARDEDVSSKESLDHDQIGSFSRYYRITCTYEGRHQSLVPTSNTDHELSNCSSSFESFLSLSHTFGSEGILFARLYFHVTVNEKVEVLGRMPVEVGRSSYVIEYTSGEGDMFGQQGIRSKKGRNQ